MGERLRVDSEKEGQFEDLFKIYYTFVVRQVMRIVSSQSIAEDVAQEVLLRLYHTDRSVIKSLPAWLTKVAFHTAYNHMRSENRHIARMEKESAHTDYIAPSTESKWLQLEEISIVRETLFKMNELDRNLILMKYSGFTYEELAEVNQLKKESVGTLLSRAKLKFKKLYENHGGVNK